MAQPDLQFFARRVLAVAASAPTSAANAIEILDGSSERMADKVERNVDRAFFGAKPTSIKNRRAKIMGTIELTPPSAPGQVTTGVASVAPVLLPCGFAQTLTADSRLTRYSPISAAIPDADAKWWHATTYLSVTSCRGDLSDISFAIGERPTAKLTLEGAYTALASAAVPTDADFSDFPVPTVSEYDNSVMVLSSLGDTAITDLHLRAKSLSVNLGNELGTKEYTEFKEARITERKATFTAVFALPDLAEFNPQAICDSREYITLYFKISEADGRYIKLAIRGQIEDVKDTNTDGDFTFTVTGSCIPSDSGNDEVVIEAGDDTFALNGTLNGGVNTVAYVADGLVASGVFVAPLTWTVSAGTLPTGLSISSVTGQITGTPTGGAGTSSFTITATDSTGGTPLTASKAVSIVVTV